MACPKPPQQSFIEGPPQVFQTHGAVLQTLNSVEKGLFLPVDAYRPTVDAWENAPIIFAQRHPTIPASEDLDAALAQVHGRQVGVVRSPRIDFRGHPRLKATLDTSADPEIERLKKAGLLDVSTGFYCTTDGQRLTGIVQPDHVLMFERTPETEPGDRGSGIFFQQGQGQDPGQDDISLLRSMWNFIMRRKQAPADSHSQEESDMDEKDQLAFQQAKKDLSTAQDTVKAKDQELHTFTEKVKALEADLVKARADLKTFQDAQVQKEKDERWVAMQKRIPKGWLDGTEKVADKDIPKADLQRQAFEKDPAAYTDKLLTFLEKNPGDTAAQGQQHGAAGAAKYPSLGRWDPMKKAYVDE